MNDYSIISKIALTCLRTRGARILVPLAEHALTELYSFVEKRLISLFLPFSHELPLLPSYLCFRVFRLSFASDFFNLLLVRFPQAEIIIVKNWQ